MVKLLQSELWKQTKDNEAINQFNYINLYIINQQIFDYLF